MNRFALVLIAASLTAPAAAADCSAELARADMLVHAVRLRDPDIDRAHAQGDVAVTCKLLRQNARDMQIARDIMQRCLSGFEQRENVSQLEASLGDVQGLIGGYCR